MRDPAGRLAPVRPRVRSPYSGDVVLLEDEIEDLLREGRIAVVILCGPPGRGKRTALAHLRARFAETRAIEFRSEHELECESVPARQLIVFSAKRVLRWFPSDWLRFEMATWGLDEALEYVEARHAGETGSVMGRLVAAGDADHLEGEPLLWCAVVDAMVVNPALAGTRAALRRLGEAEAAGVPDHRHLALWCLDRIGEPNADLTAATFVPRGLTSRSLLVQSGRARFDWVLEEILDTLRAGDLGLLTHSLLRMARLGAALGVRLADEPGIRALLRRRLWEPAAPNAALLASLVHFNDPGWLHDVPAGARAPKRLDLRDAFLPGLRGRQVDLAGGRLDGVHLPGADLLGADLTGASANKADLSGADLSGARLDGIHAVEADFRDACLAQATIEEARLVAADLRGADLHRASLRETVLEYADLRGIRAAGANFAGARLRDACVQGADLHDACFDRADLFDLDLRGTSFRGAGLDSALLTHARLDGVELQGAGMHRAVLIDTSLTGARLSGADLRGAWLSGSRMAFVDLEGADLRRAHLDHVAFHLGSSRSGLVSSPIACEGSRTGFYTDDDQHLDAKPVEEIRRANFRGADLRGAVVSETDWYLVDLRDARYDPEQEAHFRRCRALLSERGAA